MFDFGGIWLLLIEFMAISIISRWVECLILTEFWIKIMLNLGRYMKVPEYVGVVDDWNKVWLSKWRRKVMWTKQCIIFISGEVKIIVFGMLRMYAWLSWFVYEKWEFARFQKKKQTIKNIFFSFIKLSIS